MCNGTNNDLPVCRQAADGKELQWNKQILQESTTKVEKNAVVEPQQAEIILSDYSSASSLESLETKTEDICVRVTGRKRQLPINEDKLIARLGESLNAIASRVCHQKSPRAPFVGKSIPKISLVDYLKRMVRYLNEWQPKNSCDSLSVGCRAMVMAMIYIDRICSKDDTFVLSRDNVHRVCMCAVLVATKFLEDEVFPNSFWSRVAGVGLAELNHLETSFCCHIDFDLWVTDEEFNKTFSVFSRYAVGSM
mmetsp:Transcript_13511/g.15396  ORF Transcript_13511/g.15396 Transcript_13511/m.15396 type:complete len:250 (-) Transcript_13511:856-1605(-)|eukprot:CAMPEP_0184005466 /NCGR_PEP_ID=MMETSP0954-20121128/80_1 /TAXON_ID=627963 /ORGANISM="Aplanochytrium sp, Strain PBS07" /LENGTH=249 /DNA_ID=CAMNT_0026283761 /DNA_START=358 /DNA_END=1107 /DNA_ORIENTATION=-